MLPIAARCQCSSTLEVTGTRWRLLWTLLRCGHSQQSQVRLEHCSTTVINNDSLSRLTLNCFRDKVKDFIDLRGHRWAYTSPESYSGHGITIDQLKSMGENANFFGDYIRSNSHIDSLNLVLNRKCDATAIASDVLRLYLKKNPDLKNDLYVLTSWGPLPPYPIVVNSHIGTEAEQLIVQALLHMHQTKEGVSLLNKYDIVKFCSNTAQNYSFLTGQYMKKTSRSNGIANGSGLNKQLHTKMINLTKDQFSSPYY